MVVVLVEVVVVVVVVVGVVVVIAIVVVVVVVVLGCSTSSSVVGISGVVVSRGANLSSSFLALLLSKTNNCGRGDDDDDDNDGVEGSEGGCDGIDGSPSSVRDTGAFEIVLHSTSCSKLHVSKRSSKSRPSAQM